MTRPKRLQQPSRGLLPMLAAVIVAANAAVLGGQNCDVTIMPRDQPHPLRPLTLDVEVAPHGSCSDLFLECIAEQHLRVEGATSFPILMAGSDSITVLLVISLPSKLETASLSIAVSGCGWVDTFWAAFCDSGSGQFSFASGDLSSWPPKEDDWVDGITFADLSHLDGLAGFSDSDDREAGQPEEPADEPSVEVAEANDGDLGESVDTALTDEQRYGDQRERSRAWREARFPSWDRPYIEEWRANQLWARFLGERNWHFIADAIPDTARWRRGAPIPPEWVDVELALPDKEEYSIAKEVVGAMAELPEYGQFESVVPRQALVALQRLGIKYRIVIRVNEHFPSNSGGKASDKNSPDEH